MHVLRNVASIHPAWFTLNENAKNIFIAPFRYGNDELKHY